MHQLYMRFHTDDNDTIYASVPLKMFYSINNDRLPKYFKKLFRNSMRMHPFPDSTSKHKRIIHFTFLLLSFSIKHATRSAL